MSITRTREDRILGLDQHWTTVYGKYTPWLMDWGQRFGLEVHILEDLVQETWIRVMERKEKKRETMEKWFEVRSDRPSFRPFLKLILTRLAIDHIRRARNRREAFTDFSDPAAPQPEQREDRREDSDLLLLLGHLLENPDEFRTLLEALPGGWSDTDERSLKATVLFVNGGRAAEIADKLNRKIGWVYLSKERIAKKLQLILEESPSN